MAEFLSQRLIGRLGAVLFAVSGLVSLVGIATPSPVARDVPVLVTIAGLAILIGVVGWFLPWHRWPRWATLPLVPVAFVMISVGGVFSARPWTYAVYWVVTFVWLGAAQPRRVPTAFAPLAAALYIVPFVVRDADTDALSSVAVVIPVCILVGESLAWISTMLRQAERLDLRRMTDMEALLGATVSLARQADAAGAANLVAELAVRLLRGQSAVVLLSDGSGALRGTGGHRWAGRVQTLEVTWLDEPAQAALASGDVTVHAGGVAGHLTRVAKGAPALFLPLAGATASLGLVMVTFPPGHRIALDGFMSGVARTFATQASLAFERLHATQMLVDASMRDPLTGVGNRRQADALLAQLRPGDAVALLDLDHFKTVNDRFGHAAGDEVLVELAGYLDRSLRDGDAVARYGGEEFVIVLRHAGANAGSTVERLAAGWRASAPATTFSAGVATHPVDGAPDRTLAAADAALYAAKAAGRDCVRVAPLADGAVTASA